jgi:tryptophan synthase beta chain
VPGVFHVQRTIVLSADAGQICPAPSVSAGLDYPGVGPEHAWLRDSGRARYESVTDAEALDAFQWLSRTEGIVPALESAHAVAYVRRLAGTLTPETLVIVNLSGRGDKDAPQVREMLRDGQGASHWGGPGASH